MGFFGSLMGTDQSHIVEQGTDKANAGLMRGRDVAAGFIAAGYRQGNQALNGAAGVNTQQNALAVGALDQSRDGALGYLNPYMQSGAKANGMYENALGVNGIDKQREFGQNYAANDPFRAQNANFATEDLMQSLNARGLSGSGFAGSAVAEQSLRRGSQDYNAYLDRLSGQAGQGLQAASQGAQVQQNYGNARANQAGNYSNANTNIAGQRSQNFTGRGNALADLNYGYAQQRATNDLNNAGQQAQFKTAGVNNLLSIAGLGLKASGWGGFGSGSKSGSTA